MVPVLTPVKKIKYIYTQLATRWRSGIEREQTPFVSDVFTLKKASKLSLKHTRYHPVEPSITLIRKNIRLNYFGKSLDFVTAL